MAFCKDIKFTIDMDKDPAVQGQPPTRLDRLVFDFKIKKGVVDPKSTITPAKPGSTAGGLSGSCFTETEASFLSLQFTWDGATVSMSGAIYKGPTSGRVKFFGRWSASKPKPLTTRAETVEGTASEAKLLAGPGDGDTGTGTGNQT